MKFEINVLTSLMVHLVLHQVSSTRIIAIDVEELVYVEISQSMPLSQIASLTSTLYPSSRNPNKHLWYLLNTKDWLNRLPMFPTTTWQIVTHFTNNMSSVKSSANCCI